MLTYRTATLKDIPKVAELLVLVWRSCYQSFLPATFLESLSVEHQSKRHQRIFQSGTNYWVCENEQKKIVGFCSYGPPRAANLSTDLEIYTIYVHPEYQRHKIGKALLKIIENDAKHSLSVVVMEENPFLPFYLKYGFERQSQFVLDLGAVRVPAGVYQKEIL